MSSALKIAQRLLRFSPAPARQNMQRLSGPHLLVSRVDYEEEKLKWYSPEKLYPVRIRDVLNQRYQVVGKLGYGAYSTVWLCRDLHDRKYVSVKVSEANSRQTAREQTVYRHIQSIPTSHAGSKCVRTLLDSFDIITATGSHLCLVHQPLGLRLSDFQAMIPGKILPRNLLKLTVRHLLLAVDFLHSECHVTHTDIQAKNILLAIEDENVLTQLEEAEVREPSQCKVDGERVIYLSREMPLRGSTGRPVLCDFGEARIGDEKFKEDIQPLLYRAPEVILQKEWDNKVDIWSLGVLIWDFSQNKHLFNARDANNETTNLVHLAEITALLGKPPRLFLEGSPIFEEFFDKSGNWIGDVNIPSNSLEDLEVNLNGEEKALFLQFLRKMLRWVPEERVSALELLDDPWLNS